MIQKKAHPFQFPTHLDYSKSDFSTAALTVALLPGRSACLGRVDKMVDPFDVEEKLMDPFEEAEKWGKF